MNAKNIYNKIVEYRQSNLPENSYTEKHHIIPHCLGGDNSKNNLVTVTSREHYILHHLLVKIYPENRSLISAFNYLKGRLNIEKNSSPYSCIRKCEYSKINTTCYGKIPWNKNKTHSEETKQKISLSLKGKQHPMYGKSHSEETKQKISESTKKSRTGKIFVNNGIINKLVFPNNIPEGFVKGRLKS